MNPRKIMSAGILILPLTVAACGSSSGSGTSGLKGGEADNVRSAAEQVITNPKQACALLTAAALRAYTNTTGAAAKSACKAQVQQSRLPASANVVVMTLHGDVATAAYSTPVGNVGAMALKKVNGTWLMDQVRLITPR
jgi:hypothetical protein